MKFNLFVVFVTFCFSFTAFANCDFNVKVTNNKSKDHVKLTKLEVIIAGVDKDLGTSFSISPGSKETRSVSGSWMLCSLGYKFKFHFKNMGTNGDGTGGDNAGNTWVKTSDSIRPNSGVSWTVEEI